MGPAGRPIVDSQRELFGAGGFFRRSVHVGTGCESTQCEQETEMRPTLRLPLHARGLDQ